MSDILNTLVEMGFSRNRAEEAITQTNGKSIEEAMEWLLTHDELQVQPEPNLVPDAPATSSEAVEEKSNTETSEKDSADDPNPQEAKSLKCDDCGKLFRTSTEVEFHAAKSGHSNFSESTEEKQPLTEEEKKEQLAKIEAKLKQRRLEREAREKQDELDREKSRIRSGKDLLEAKRKQEETEMKKVLEQRKREKQDEKLARERVKQQIEEDRLARKAKFSGATEAEPPKLNVVVTHVAKPVVNTTYSEVKLQIKLTNGVTLTETFGAKEPLSAVRVFVEINRTDEPGPFALRVAYPAKVFNLDDYDKPLESLGLAPSAVLVVSKT